MVNAHCIEDFVQPCEYSVGRIEVADDCHRRVPEKLVHSSCAEVVLDAALR